MNKENTRCAVYTRKSSEEGLEQSFNSLDAQREACQAFILSQKHEGWAVLHNRYDDGGFSGGSMERPALKQLLDDILAGKIDTVVVYKVDRLTRSLADFAKIIEVFDANKVSFVSVTQQFNTTTSMGRLTLNVLLSFAQFEREVTGERIRDKIAASKKKGMWMGGVVPLGYECIDHHLIVNQPDAETVREIFSQYLRLGCVSKLREHLKQQQIRSKVRTSAGGRTWGGVVYSRGALYHLLRNRIYIGDIVHRTECYRGEHEAIISSELWEKVAAHLHSNNQAHRAGKSQSTASLLTGIVFDVNGVRLTPTHALKNGKRYRYYTSQAAIQHSGDKAAITRFPAQEIEKLVISQIHLLLRSPEKCTAGLEANPERDIVAERVQKLANTWPQLELEKQHDFIRSVVQRVVVGQTTVWIEVDRAKLALALLERKTAYSSSPDPQQLEPIKLQSSFEMVRRGGEMRIHAPHDGSSSEQNPTLSLIRALARARDWYEQIVSGEVDSVGELARTTGLSTTYINRILPCSTLSPQITQIILSGKHRVDLSLDELLRGCAIDWLEQKNRFRVE